MNIFVFEVPFALDDPLDCAGVGTSRPRREEKEDPGFPRI